MSKRWQKETKRTLNNECDQPEEDSLKRREYSSLAAVIGTFNVKRWNELKVLFSCETDEEFASCLLDFAQKHIHRKSKELAENVSTSDSSGLTETFDQNLQHNIVRKVKKGYTKQKSKKKFRKSLINPKKEQKRDKCLESILQSSTNTKNIASDLQSTSEISDNVPIKESNCDDLELEEIDCCNNKLQESIKLDDHVELPVINKCKRNIDNSRHKRASGNQKGEIKILTHQRKKNNYDVRKAPKLTDQTDHTQLSNIKSQSKSEEKLSKRVAIRIKICCSCGIRHIQDHCPFKQPSVTVKDSISLDGWIEKYKTLYLNETSSLKISDDSQNATENINETKNENMSFAYLSLPNLLYFDESKAEHGLGVFANKEIKEFTQFGPLIGKLIKEVDIPEECLMRDIWELPLENEHVYINTECLEEGNWMRYVRPAPVREERNVIAFVKCNEIFMVSTKLLLAGEELLYWQDDALCTNKKKMEKTICGGCNMTFSHPLYYRTHCSVFHDVRYSLTIRKYHCKICGAAVLGKENIMKHAAELHNGQGAYQCQFCKKFFLRLNYLEMHRTYGCSANPHRSRPLCDFCGRKFCQPQKLKVHIKRMHSDMSEVLKEFQCKSCLKLLGSRAALQRHMKEVHNKQIGGSSACSRCGKLFQNKSNLKIHMLTHSGIKPFKCMEKNCNAAFTTKQCLQFHYKKAHGYSDDQMPKIARSVDYTFEAYSGVDDQDEGVIKNHYRLRKKSTESILCLDNASDGDDISLEERSGDEPPTLHSPLPIMNENSDSNHSPPILEAFTNANPNMKILSKGSKKWLGEKPLQILKSDVYPGDENRSFKSNLPSNLNLDTSETQNFSHSKLNVNMNSYNRHDSSNASLLVEAALDSVSDIPCSESNMDIDVNTTSNDVLVNNLYTLAHTDTLTDVTYSHTVDINDSRDISLISPSVNEHISVSDDLNNDLQHGHEMGIDYSSFQQEDFSPAGSPNMHSRSTFDRNYVNVHPVSPNDEQNYEKNHLKEVSPTSSPQRYCFDHTANVDRMSSDDSNEDVVQNLSLHNMKDESHLDLSIYKSPYNLEVTNFQLYKEMKLKHDLKPDRKQLYFVDVENISKNYENDALDESTSKYDGNESSGHAENNETSELSEKNFENVQNSDEKDKNLENNLNLKAKYHESLSNDLHSKAFESDIELRLKTCDNIDTNTLRIRNNFDSTIDTDFRSKNYELLDSIETRSKAYDTLIEAELRHDRSFEPFMLNATELQGLDMSSRNCHSFHPGTVPNLNRYHLYPDVEHASVDLRLNYSPPPSTYTHADVLRVVSLDLTSPSRHSVDLSLRNHPLHPHQISNTRLLGEHGLQTNRILTDHGRLTLDQSRLLSSELSSNRHLTSDGRLLTETSSRLLTDHTTNRLLSTDQISANRLLTSDPNRLISEETRLMEQGRLLSEGRILPPTAPSGSISPVPYSNYSVPGNPYHHTSITPRTHTTSPTPAAYHHYSSYY